MFRQLVQGLEALAAVLAGLLLHLRLGLHEGLRLLDLSALLRLHQELGVLRLRIHDNVALILRLHAERAEILGLSLLEVAAQGCIVIIKLGGYLHLAILLNQFFLLLLEQLLDLGMRHGFLDRDLLFVLSSVRIDEILYDLLYVGLAEQLLDAWPLIFIFIEKSVDDLLEFRGIAIWNKVSLLLHNFYHQPKQVVGVKGVLKCAKLVENAPQRPDIGFIGIRFTLAYLRTHIEWSSDYCLRFVVCVVEHSADTEVAEFNGSVGSQKNV